MAIDRPEMLGDGFVEREDGRRISMQAFVDLMRLVPDKGRSAHSRGFVQEQKRPLLVDLL